MLKMKRYWITLFARNGKAKPVMISFMAGADSKAKGFAKNIADTWSYTKVEVWKPVRKPAHHFDGFILLGEWRENTARTQMMWVAKN